MPDDCDNEKCWTPMLGLRKGAIWGTITACILAIGLAPVAHYAPYLLLNFFLRVAVAWLITWILFVIIHYAGGMTCGIFTTLAVILALAVMCSNHLVWAFTNIPTSKGTAPGGLGIWLHPGVLFFGNISSILGIGFCAAISKNGAPGSDSLCSMLTQPMYGRTR